MLSSTKLNKIDRKLKKLQHVVLKETGINCTFDPTNNLVICNAGLVNGLSEETIFNHFSPYGVLLNIILLPEKSCCFLSFSDLSSAIKAFENCNGRLGIAQNHKPIYLLYTTTLPLNDNFPKIWKELPPGLVLFENFINEEEEQLLLKLCSFHENDKSEMKNRQVKHYGYEFRYDINNVDKDKPLPEGIPNECNFLFARLQNSKFNHFYPDQLTINYYKPGHGIPNHVDTHSAFEDPIMSLSLQSAVVMEFKQEKKEICVLLPQRSLAIMSGESRYNWTHGITPRKYDIIHTEKGYTSIQRNIRISFTFRKILQGECYCIYKTLCDSYKKQNGSLTEDSAIELEKLHVHSVYENIATHFSDTRHKPWPNVLEFVNSFENGSVLLDVGCGNGKYLEQNTNNFKIGCDTSFGLLNICKEKDFETFVGNCLNLPIQNCKADGAISIAVIHHLSTEERRLRALKEMVRILKLGGLALIYVWAKDQFKGQEKSSYIKQDRKNRKKDEIVTSPENQYQKISFTNEVALPIHVNRTQFKHKDVLVPWKLKNNCETESTFLRYYHVFEEGELEELCSKLNCVDIIKSYYDQGNWCVVIRKLK